MRFVAEAAVTSCIRIFEGLVGSPVRFVALHLPFPACGPRADYEALGFSEIIFDAAQLGIFGDAEDLDLQVDALDTEVKEQCGRQCADLVSMSKRTMPLSQKVEMLLRMDGRVPALGEVAAKLGLSDRQLHRELAAEGITYGRILAQSRYCSAIHMLERNEFSIKDIAWRLGFDDADSLGRAFRGWAAGLSPTGWRQRIASGAVSGRLC